MKCAFRAMELARRCARSAALGPLRTLCFLLPVLLLAGCSPEIVSVRPVLSEPAGGGELVIEGKNLSGSSAEISIADMPVTIERHTKSEIRGRIPPGQPGPTELRIAIGDGFEQSFEFKYLYRRLVTVARADEADKVGFTSLVDRKQALLAAVAPLGVEVLEDQPDLPTLILGIPGDAALKAVESDPNVAGISSVQPIRLDTVQSLKAIHHDWAKALPAPQGGPFMGQGTTVMVLDSGLEWRNGFFGCPTLGAPGCKVAKMVEFAPEDGTNDDSTRHGTNVSAIVLSVAPGTRVIAGDVIGGGFGGTSDAILRGVQWAMANRETYKIAAVNMSLSVPGSETSEYCLTDPISAAVSFARFSGLVMAISTSNDYHPDKLLIPGCSPFATRVGALYDAAPKLNRETDFSNAWDRPFMVAPGSVIEAAGIAMEGTSQATPHVAGAAAVLRAAFPAASVEFIERRLMNSGPLVVSKNAAARPRRLDLYAALVDQTARPAPAPRHHEWAWTPGNPGARAPISDRPRLEVENNPRFVTDRATGLSWLAALPGEPAAGPLDVRAAQERCRQLPGGLVQYRLPTRAELVSLFDFSAPAGKRLLVPELGPIEGDTFWTLSPSDTLADSGIFVWTSREGNFYQATALVQKATALCVSPILSVPAEPPAGRFSDEGATILDSANELRWLKATGGSMDTVAAMDWCTARTDAGRHWRLPTAREALSIADVVRDPTGAVIPAIFGPAEDRITQTDYPYTDDGTISSFRWWGIAERTGTTQPDRTAGAVRCVENTDPAASYDGVHVGDVTIDGPDAAEKYQRFVRSAFREVRGDIIVNAPTLGHVRFQRLEKVVGSVLIGNLEAADHLAMQRLEEVTGSVAVENTAVRWIGIHRLRTIGRDLRIANNRRLGIDQPGGTNGDGADAPLKILGLETIGGSLEVENNRELKAFGGRLAAIGKDLTVSGNDTLERFRLSITTLGGTCPLTGQCGTAWVGLNPRLEYFQLPVAQTLRWGIDVQNNPVLTGFSAGAARMNALFRVEGNTLLCARTAVDGGLAASLRKQIIGEISVKNNRYDTVDRVCSSRCPDLDHCALLPTPPPTAQAIRERRPVRHLDRPSRQRSAAAADRTRLLESGSAGLRA